MNYIIKAETFKDEHTRVYCTVTDDNNNFIASFDEFTPDPMVIINKIKKLLSLSDNNNYKVIVNNKEIE